MNRLRWKKGKRETGLRSIVAGNPGSYLHDGETTYAYVREHSERHTGRKGWYWSCPSNEASGIEHMNTASVELPSEAEAKAEAQAYIKKCLAKHQKSKV